ARAGRVEPSTPRVNAARITLIVRFIDRPPKLFPKLAYSVSPLYAVTSAVAAAADLATFLPQRRFGKGWELIKRPGPPKRDRAGAPLPRSIKASRTSRPTSDGTSLPPSERAPRIRQAWLGRRRRAWQTHRASLAPAAP